MITPKEYLSSEQFLEHRFVVAPASAQILRIPTQLLKFKDFAPKVFHQIRGVFQVEEKEIAVCDKVSAENSMVRILFSMII